MTFCKETHRNNCCNNTAPMPTKNAVLFINLGTPKSPSVFHVFSYLREFLTDWRVISLPYILRQILVNCIIIPRRVRQSSRNYSSIWMKEGSPLMVHSMRFMKAVEASLLSSDISCYFAMRYQEPSIKKVLHEIEKKGHSSLLILPLYPQYASATTGSCIETVMSEMMHWKAFPQITIASSFFHNEWFIDAWVEKIYPYVKNISNDTKVLFCFHGLPKKQVIETNPKGSFCFTDNCCNDRPSQELCYVAQCRKTAEAIKNKLHIDNNQYELVFQSRLGRDPWTGPFISERLKELPQEGVFRVIVISASFVADCIETLEELDQECNHIFLKSGGKEFILVESLNDSKKWVESIHSYIHSHFNQKIINFN